MNEKDSKEKKKTYKDIVDKYARDVASGKKIAGAEIVAACERYLQDLKRTDIEMRPKQADAWLREYSPRRMPAGRTHWGSRTGRSSRS